MANILLPVHLSLSHFQVFINIIFFFPLGKVNNWKYNLSDKLHGFFQHWVSALSKMDFGHGFFFCTCPYFPYKKFHNLQNSSSRWDRSLMAFRALGSFLTMSFSSSPFPHPKWVLGACTELARVAPNHFCPGSDPLLAILQMEKML